MEIRDPIHGIIQLTPLERTIIDQPLFQRLRLVKQLTSVDLIFPGATHTRFAHSIGVCHVAGLYAAQLKLDIRDIALVRMAALLHDIAHGPFSHLFDKTVYAKTKWHDHDGYRHHLIKQWDHIFATGNFSSNEISAVWSDAYPELSTIVHGPMGADRIDFIQRDAYYCGTMHFGTIAADRIISNAKLIRHKNHDRLTYNTKVCEDICQALFARYYMYKNVYLHKTAVASAILLEIAIEKWLHDNPDVLDELEDPAYLLNLTDEQLIGRMLLCEDAQPYVRRYLNRDLPKMISEEFCPVADQSSERPIGQVSKDINGKLIITFYTSQSLVIDDNSLLSPADTSPKEERKPRYPLCTVRDKYINNNNEHNRPTSFQTQVEKLGMTPEYHINISRPIAALNINNFEELNITFYQQINPLISNDKSSEIKFADLLEKMPIFKNMLNLFKSHTIKRKYLIRSLDE